VPIRGFVVECFMSILICFEFLVLHFPVEREALCVRVSLPNFVYFF
jgi:hypothetical protein